MSWQVIRLRLIQRGNNKVNYITNAYIEMHTIINVNELEHQSNPVKNTQVEYSTFFQLLNGDPT